MKKFTIILMVLITVTVKTNALTNVSGFISGNTNWTLAGSPYIITGNVLLDSGYILTIDPGVTVKFNSAKSLQINGVLRAIGTSNDPITFTSNQNAPAPGDWGYILFTDKSTDYSYTLFTGSIMEYCIVEYAGDLGVNANNAAIRITSSYPFINYCTVRNNKTTGITYFDPSAPSATGLLKITNCNIHDNSSVLNNNPRAGGINIDMNIDNVIISNNTISNNHSGSDGGGITCMVVNGTSSVISDNLIYNNSALGNGGGIISSPVEVLYNTIYNNSAVNYGGGIYYSTSQSTAGVSNNIIANNYASDGAIYLMYNYYWDSNSLIEKNTIIDNTTVNSTINCWLPTSSGIYNNTITRNKSTAGTPTGTIYLNQGSLHNVKNNNIYGNLSTYQLWNSYSQGAGNDINAQNNWWGTTSTTIIDSVIYDYFDAPTQSIVYYNPIHTSPDTIAPVTPVVNVVKTDLGGGDIKISWDANTEIDLGGYNIYYGSPTGYSFSNFVNAGNVTTDTISGVLITDTIAVTAYDNQMDSIQDQMDGNESWFTYAVGKPIVTFSAVSTTICPDDTVLFTDNTIDAESWSWIFSGGMPAVSSDKNPKVIYSAPGVYDVKLIVTNIAGTDSATYTSYITVNDVSYATISTTSCNSGQYTSPSGLYTWTSSGTYHDTIQNYLGCDSILTVNLTIGYDSYSSLSPVICDSSSYVSPSGNYTWTGSGTYYDTIPNASGCDSLLTIILSVYNMDTSITINGYTLTSNTSGVNYQWLDCNNGYSEIFGEYNQSYTPLTSGNYAVKIYQSSCIDTSFCYQVTVTGMNILNNNKGINIYPNPASNLITLNIDRNDKEDMILNVYNVMGALVKTQAMNKNQQNINISNLNNGIYLLEIKSDNFTEKQKLIIQR